MPIWGAAPDARIRGAQTDPRSDLYALGATLYELLGRRSPPPALQREEARASRRVDPLRPLVAVNPTVPDRVAAAIQAALHLDARRRPPHARALHVELLEALAGCEPGIPDQAPDEAQDEDWQPTARRAVPQATTLFR
jgi:serine/threonine protein kinase